MPPLACVNVHEPLFFDFSRNTHVCFSSEVPKRWSTCKSSSLYQIDAWGAPYFLVNEKGNMAIRPHGKATSPNQEIDLMLVLQKVMGSVALPLIIRFPDILKHRLQALHSAFDYGIRLHNYQRRFLGVFPVKCNQDRFVVENIVEFGKPYGFGLEAGSKPELLMAMSYLCKGSSDALLICNGYKDSEYVSLALTARSLGLNSVIVLEQAEELDLVMKISQKLCIQPVIGIRAKLNTNHGGHFGETSGERGKFGLTCVEIVEIVQNLRRVGMLDCLQLLHFHIGSQIPSLFVLNDGVTEAAHIYCELALMGANMNYIDVGGGLGIDYDGSRSGTSDMSVAYTIDEYAEEVVIAVKTACVLKNVKQPILCSESGRALVSHHSVLVFNVFSSQERLANGTIDLGAPLEVDGLPENLSLVYKTLAGYARNGDYDSSLECARWLKVKAIDMFKKGRLNLVQLARINSTCEVVSERRRKATSKYLDRNRWGDETDSTVYHINLSVFKCMPDTWGIGQIFPVVPLHRLDEKPAVRAILSDLTCDSDGKISKFIGTDGMGNSRQHLPVHALKPDEPYFLGMFLGGAYQEALGGLHNMFGNPSVVHVVQQQHCGNAFKITQTVPGQSSADVLRCMQHDPHAMFEVLKRRVGERMNADGFGEEDTNEEAAASEVMENLACTFQSIPYLKAGTNSGNSRGCDSRLTSTLKRANSISGSVAQAYCWS